MFENMLVLAGILLLLVAAIHSALGEVLIFRQLRDGGIVPTRGEPLLQERRIRILWASWHVVTICGWAFGAILLRLAYPIDDTAMQAFVINSIIAAMLASSALVLFATRGKHPGWLGLLGVAVLAWLAQ